MIEGKNIKLRTITEFDLAEIFTLSSKLWEKGEYWSVILPSDVLLQRRFTESGFWDDRFGKMLITDKSNKFLGDIFYFQNADYRSGYEIGYQLYQQEHRGKGIMPEALTLFSAYLFSLKPIPRLQITCIKGNIPSRRVAEKCGFQYEGTLRQATFNRGEYYDLELFSLLREECLSLTAVLANAKGTTDANK
jgi:RimJ/RimL family protein N-acetyltransferase